jgi:regulator of RNase E activity RraA
MEDNLEKIAAQFRKIPTCTAMDLLKAHEPARLVLREVKSLLPLSGSIAGPARTLRFLPKRSDVVRSPKGQPQFDVIDNVRAGEVLVFDTIRGLGGSVMGDMLALRAKVRGAAAVVTDGVMRDMPGMASVGIPIFASGTWPVPSASELTPWESDTPIQCGGALVLPGDWILADTDAVIVIPSGLVQTVLEGAVLHEAEEIFCRTLLSRGLPLRQSFPMPLSLRPLYESYLKSGIFPSDAEVRAATP